MSNYYHKKLNAIRIALGMQLKMAEATLDDGVTRVSAESFEAGKKIFVVSESGEEAPAPEGTHTTEEGLKITVDAEGTITAVEEPEEVTIEASEEEEEEKNGSSKEEDKLFKKLKMKFEEELPSIVEEIIEEKIEEMIDSHIEENMKSYKMESEEIIEQIVQDLLEIKEEMSSYKQKMSKTPGSSKFSTFNANPAEADKISDLDARLEQLNKIKSQFTPKKRF
jgi:hypothetical protein